MYWISRYEYSRSGNPTRDCLEKCLAALDGGKYAITFSSGLAATATVTQLLKSGEHVVAMDDLYGGTNRYFRKVASNMGILTSFVDATNPKKVAEAIQPNTRMVWIETPTNPTLKVVDIQAVAEIVHSHKNIFLVVDNTFESAYFQRPLELGMFSHKMSLITIFGQKNFRQKFHQKFDIFHEKISTASDFGSYLVSNFKF